MAATIAVSVRREIKRRREANESLRSIAQAVGVSVTSVQRFIAEPLPEASSETVELEPMDGTLRSQIAHEFGPRRQPFRMMDVTKFFPDRHRVLVARHVKRLLGDGVIEKVGFGLYIGRAEG